MLLNKPERIVLQLPKKKLLRLLAVLIFFFASAHVLTQLVYFKAGPEFVQKNRLIHVVRQFNLDEENNIPTWYQSISVLCCAALLAVIAAAKRQERDAYATHWATLAIIFVGLSIDEDASLHNMLDQPVHDAFHLGSFLHQAWVIPAIIFVAIVAVWYLRFLLHLTPRERLWLILSGIVYVAGAAGMEIIDVRYKTLHGENLTYSMLTLVEETLEMLGILMFLHTLLTYLETHLTKFGISLERTGSFEPVILEMHSSEAVHQVGVGA
jgi:glucan phosphoethanolaminetransferase (alkaline phosphatase superfamily)